jgi:lysyl-tRNA synthetase class 2
VEEALRTFEQSESNLPEGIFIAGRIIGILDDGFVLQDTSGRVDLKWKEKVNVGDIVEVRLWAQRAVGKDRIAFLEFLAREAAVLAPCGEDFFIGKGSPNYLKAVIDENFKEKLMRRERLTKELRDFFWKRGFMEVSTPELVRLPGMEPNLDVFKTEDMYLITSPEYAMKKLLVSGLEKIFQITKSFRNKETNSPLHNPEFTILEWYRAYSDYTRIMKDMEELVCELAVAANGKPQIFFKDYKIDVAAPWPKVKVKDLFKDFAGVDHEVFEDAEKFRAAVSGKGYKVDDETPYEELFFLVFLNEIEPKLGLTKPVIVYEYPVQMAGLAKKCEEDSRYSERFEVYIGAIELCNAFTELNDPVEQKARLEAEHEQRKLMGKADYGVDQGFISALNFGMPPSGGVALGVDRLMMLLTNTADIRDLLFFPHNDL